MFMQVNQQQVLALEKATRGQAGNKTWFCHREGRITASNLKKCGENQSKHAFCESNQKNMLSKSLQVYH